MMTTGIASIQTVTDCCDDFAAPVATHRLDVDFLAG